MPDLTAMTRQEKFLNGDTDMEPITRREYFYAGRESELPEGHQEPETREEWFIQKYRGGGGDVTVVPLSVTENGTYSEEGKAYSPVEVDVPLPSNAYLLKSVANLPQAIASFNDGEEMVMPSLKVAIEPQQEGSGDPSPTNIRPISGWSEVNVTRTGKNLFDKVNCGVYNGYIAGTQVYGSPNHRTIYIPCKPNTTYSSANFSGNNRKELSYSSEVPSAGLVVPTPLDTITTDANAKYLLCYCYNANSDTVSFDDVKNALDIELGSVVPTSYSAYAGNTYTIDLDGTRYGGELDVVNGTMTVDRAIEDLGALNYTKFDVAEGTLFRTSVSGAKLTYNVNNIICSAYKYSSKEARTNGTFSIPDTTNIDFINDSYTTESDFKTAMNGVQLVYELATPLTIQLTPTQVKSLLGQNNVWADTGDITDAEYFSKEV